MTGFEPVTSSLPRKCSTPELRWLLLSGRRGSNPLPKAWKAFALPNELLPQFCGGGWTRTTELIRGQIYSLLQLPLCDSPVFYLSQDLDLSRRRDLDPRPRDYKSRALPLSYAGFLFIILKNLFCLQTVSRSPLKRSAKIIIILESTNVFSKKNSFFLFLL